MLKFYFEILSSGVYGIWIKAFLLFLLFRLPVNRISSVKIPTSPPEEQRALTVGKFPGVCDSDLQGNCYFQRRILGDFKTG